MIQLSHFLQQPKLKMNVRILPNYAFATMLCFPAIEAMINGKVSNNT